MVFNKECNMMFVRLILPLLLIVASMAGCSSTSNEDPAEPKPGLTQASFHLPQNGAVLVRVDAFSDTTLNMTLANNRDDGTQLGQGMQNACASAQWATNASFVGGDGRNWAEPGPGAAVRAGAGGEGLELLGGAGGWLLAVDFRGNFDNMSLSAGETMWFRLGAVSEDAENPVYKPSLDLTIQGDVAIEEVDAPDFACSGSGADSDGTYLQTSVGPAATVIRDGGVTVETSHATDVRVGVAIHPRFPGSCQVTILLDGTSVAESAETNAYCGASYEGPPGVYDIEYEATATDGHIRWFIWG